MSVIRRITGAFRPSAEKREVARIQAYEATQREICATVDAVFDPPDYRKLAGLAPSVVAGHLPVRGTRHVGETIEWFILADDEPAPQMADLSLQHLHHLATIREDLVMYLGLPVGWSFAVLADGLRTWAAFPPSDQLAARVDEFIANRSANEAEMIQGILDESFAEVEAARHLSGQLTGYLDEGREPPDFEVGLRAIADVVRGMPGDRRATDESASSTSDIHRR